MGKILRVIIILCIVNSCVGCGRSAKEIELQSKVDQLQEQLNELTETELEMSKDYKKTENEYEDSEDYNETENEKMNVEVENTQEENFGNIETEHIDLSDQTQEQIYNNAIDLFKNGEFIKAQQMFVFLNDFQDSYEYRQYLELLIRIQSVNYEYVSGENIGDVITIDGFDMYIDGEKHSLRVLKKFSYYYLTTASTESNNMEVCISGDRGKLKITNMQFKDGEISVFVSTETSCYMTMKRIEEEQARRKEIELQWKNSKNGYKNESAYEPSIGMSARKVEKSTWGVPDRINKTTYAWGTTEQWCYKENRYIYFENGYVIAIQDSY